MHSLSSSRLKGLINYVWHWGLIKWARQTQLPPLSPFFLVSSLAFVPTSFATGFRSPRVDQLTVRSPFNLKVSILFLFLASVHFFISSFNSISSVNITAPGISLLQGESDSLTDYWRVRSPSPPSILAFFLTISLYLSGYVFLLQLFLFFGSGVNEWMITLFKHG